MATSSTAVNKPTDEKAKEIDVNTKLQLYGIYSAFANGKVPSNKQIDVALNTALQSKLLSSPSNKLSEDGQHLVQDLRNVIEQAKILILTKNEGNLLQDFIWQTQQISGGNASVPGAPVDKDTAKQHGNEALEGLRTLGTLIISNGQFRKLLNDASVLLRSIAGDAASKTANKVQPSEEALNRIDDPAEDNTWHDVPDMSKGNIKGQIKSRTPFNKGDAQKAVGDATQAAHPSGERNPQAAADYAAREQRETGGTGNTSMDPTAGAKAGLDTMRQQASEAIPDERKDQAKDYKHRTNRYLKNKMPEERREQTIWRLKKMIVEIQGHQDYQRAIETLLRLAEEYQGHTKNIAQQSHGAVKGAHQDSALELAEADLKTLIERFANSTSTDDLFDSVNQIYRDADQDPELKGWFRKMDAYIRKCLQQQGFILQDQATDEWNALYDQGNYLLRDKYRGHTDRIVDEIKFFGNQFDEDTQNKRFGESVQKLFLDLGNDENGQPAFKPHLLKDLTEVIIPQILAHSSYFPVPRIEYQDPMMDVVVENIIIESDNLFPNAIEIGSDNYWRMGRKTIASKNKNKVMFSVSGVQMDIRDISYYVKKKTGFPSITDEGLIDIFMGGTGLSFKIEGETADKTDRAHLFKINKVDVDMKNMKLKIKKSKHKLLFSLAKPILLKVLRPAIQKVIEKKIKDSAMQLDGIMYDVQKEVDRAKADFKRNPDPENAQNIYQRYAAAANKKVMQGKEKKKELEAKTADKKVNMAVTQHDSIFPTVKLPGGISTKATEYKDLAAKGDKWESPIFSIGSGKESSGLPKIAQIQRKSRHTGGSGVGGQSSGLGGQSGYGNQYGLGGQSGYGQSGQSGYDQYDGQQGYGGQSTQPGYGGQSNQSGYGAQSGLGSNGGLTGTGSGQGFSNQVDQAFKPTNGAATGVNSAIPGQGQHTTLGQHNPVLTGNI
ncbi:hypothetical protein EJ08DRAFT_613446 [Tothia fuscella]|uniref:Uncharacterized protein n=1 Tax=Tothia fuscella TaxID=1048955 RepID=A0A9P4NR31_9PEZI|nr:hypothetical protein EJ08DRAFT_613446 [Tothia fuscella]